MSEKYILTGTKADNLYAVMKLISKSNLLPQLSFTVKEWIDDSSIILEKIYAKEKEWSIYSNNYAVRSSACDEDTHNYSNAGHYKSLLNVEQEKLFEAIEEVIEEYDHSLNYMNNQVLIQPCLQDILISGVAFNLDPNTSGNYFIINYAPQDSTLVTSGRKCLDGKKYICFSQYQSKDLNMNKLIQCIKEIEDKISAAALDIEFAILLSGEVYILQVRELCLSCEKIPIHAQENTLLQIKKYIVNNQKHHPFLYGETTIYSVMSDWNPAEMIGIHPKPLALSLYKELITDSVWAYQRDNYGYMNLRSFPLMLDLEGFPYIDTRVSFNSFLPKDLQPEICEKLVNYYLRKLKENPEKHDKVEFDIVFSCYAFDTEDKCELLRKENFSIEEIKLLSDSLKKLTNNIINNGDITWKNDLRKIKIIDERNKKIKNSSMSRIEKIYWILEDCKRFGTLPFAGLARAAFISIQILKSMVTKEILSTDEYNEYLGQICSISTEMKRDLSVLSREENICKYGHLRPGTYEITSERYDENPDLYLSGKDRSNDKSKPFRLSIHQIKLIQEEIDKQCIGVSAIELFDFIETTIKGREYAKFIFTKNVSDLLYLIELLGKEMDISREDLSYMDINVIKLLYGGCSDIKTELIHSIKQGKERYMRGNGIILPSIIFHSDDIYNFFSSQVAINFITQNKAVGEIIVLDNNVDNLISGDKIKEKIILIESADPGYDWIFANDIKGLVTMWGGANSHMAIRAGEMKIPAAIGVGEDLFTRISQHHVIEIDAMQKKLEVIR